MHDAILKREQGKEGRKKGGEGEKNQGAIYIGLSVFKICFNMEFER